MAIYDKFKKDFLEKVYKYNIQESKTRQEQVEWTKRKELLEDNDNYLKTMLDIQAIVNISIEQFIKDKYKTKPKEDKAIRDIKSHAEVTEKQVERIIKERGYER